MNFVMLKRRARMRTGVMSWMVMVFTVCLLTFSWYQ